MRSSILLLTAGLLLTACAPSRDVGPAVRVSGLVHAGPTCPVVQDPPDPGCDDRPVSGAVLVVLDRSGRELARVVSDATGRFVTELSAGSYTLQPQPVDGLLGTAPAQDFEVADTLVELDVSYDTGIR